LIELKHSQLPQYDPTDPRQVGVIAQTSGLSLILVTEDALVGGADKRRDGTVGGSNYPGKSKPDCSKHSRSKHNCWKHGRSEHGKSEH